MSTESLPRRIGKYELRQKLGQGGMGTVYRALEIGLHRSVAVKLMKSEYRDNAGIRQRFIQEARAVAALDHPNIIKIFYFDDEPELYLVMEFVPSGSLRGYLRHHQEDGNVLEVREALQLTRQIADALQVAHNHQMIHRDVKPDNVLLKSLNIRRQTNFHPLLTDFGLVKLAEDVGYQTQPGTAIGTYAYMSPEQLKGSGVDHRTDLYALGIMLYELVVGRLPFHPKTPSQAYDMHHYQEPPLPSDLRPGLTPSLENLILRAIAKNPDDRFQSALDMSDALHDIESGQSEQLTQLDSMASQGGQLESLSQYMTALPGTPVDDDVSRLDTPQDLPNDRIAIQRIGEDTFYVELTRPTFIIGRTDDADITLPTNQVSRQHARINKRRDGTYTITDLGSTNHTFVDGVEILSDVPEPWSTAQLVSIGEYRLTLQLAAGMQDTHPQMERPSLEGIASPTGDTAPSRVGGQLHTAQANTPVILQLSPSTITVQAGSQSTVNLALRSMATTVEHYLVSVQGIPNDWVSIPAAPLQLMPGSSASIPISFRPPLAPTSAAGDYQFRVRVTSHERGREVTYTDGTLSIPPFHRFSTDMTPQRVTSGQIINLTLENNGNVPENFSINARDRAAAIKFDPPTANITVNPGEREVLRIQPHSKAKWLGTPEMFPLEIRATSTSGQEQLQTGELILKPRLPAWMAGILSLLCAGLVMFGAYVGFIRDDNDPTTTPDRQVQNDTSTPTREPSATYTLEASETPELAPEQLTATANAQATETAQAELENNPPVTLTVGIIGGEDEESAFENAMQQTETDSRYSFEIVEIDRDILFTQIAGGNPPDLILAPDDIIWELANAGALFPLDFGGQSDAFTDASLSTVSLDGDFYGVPYSVDTLAFVCHIELLEEYGIGNTPEFGFDTILDAGLPIGTSIDTYHFVPILHAFGGYIFGIDSSGHYDTADIGIINGQGSNALHFLETLASERILREPQLAADEVVENFLGYAFGCIITGSWNFQLFEESGINYIVIPIRASVGEEPGAAWISTRSVAVPATGENHEIALDLVNNVFPNELFQAVMVENIVRPPVFRPFITEDDYTGLNGFALVAQYGKRTPYTEMIEVWGPMGSILKSLVGFEISVDEAVAELTEVFDSVSFSQD